MEIYRTLLGNEIKSNRLTLKLIEDQYKVSVPSLYMQFQLTYKTGQYSEKWKSYIDKYLRVMPLNKIFFKSNEIEIPYGWIFNPNEIALDLKYYPDAKKNLLEYQMIRIGNIVSGGGLFLGVGEKNADSIYKMIWDHDSIPIKISNSIFQFIEKLVVVLHSNVTKYKFSVGGKYGLEKNVSFEIKNEIINKIRTNVSTNSVNEKELLIDLNKIAENVRNKNIGIS